MNLKISSTLHKQISINDTPLPKEYSIEKSDNGNFIVTKNSRAVHSKYNIDKESASALSNIENTKKNIIVFYGFGLGFTVKYLANNFTKYFNNPITNKNIQIIVVIDDIHLFRYAYYQTDLSVLESLNIYFIYKEESPNSIINTLSKKSIKGVEFILLKSLDKEEKEEGYNFYSNFCKEVEVSFANILTNMNFENLWTRNIILNTSMLINSKDISTFKNIFNSLSCILICSGPTLEYSINEIKIKKNDLIIIAVDTALSVLLKNNIIPHFVITVDAGLYNAYDFIFERKYFPYIVMDTATHHLIKNIINKNTNIITFSSLEDSSLIKAINKNTNVLVSNLFITNTAATTMIDFANYLGLSKILLVGFDNSYPLYYRHSKHSLSYEFYINKTDKLNTLETYYFNSIKNVSNINAYPPTDYTLERQLEYFNNINKMYPEINIMRLKKDAIDIKNIPDGKIDDVIIPNIHSVALETLDKIYSENKNDLDKKESLKNLYTNMNDSILSFKSELIDIYNEVMTNKSNDSALEIIYENTMNKIETYKKDIHILDTILKSTLILAQRPNHNIFNKLIFILSETIKNTNYFHTRISKAIKSL